MATATNSLTLEEFRSRYAEEKPYYEYWFGEAVQKSEPTLFHVLLVKILMSFLDRAGYESGAELELRIDQNWQPKPDVAAMSTIEAPYPTKPVDVVVEVLSPDDRMQRVIEKCRQYVRIGIPAIFIMDPELRYAWEWSRTTENLERISAMLLPNGEKISVVDLWKDLDRRLKPKES
jgi:Uma2 family endonuclease